MDPNEMPGMVVIAVPHACPHEEMAQRATLLLAAIVMRLGGSIELTEAELRAVNGRYAHVRSDDGGATVQVEIRDSGPPDEPKVPTHAAPRGVQ